MLEVYVTLIIKQKRTLETIPSQFRGPAAEMLKDLGLSNTGEPIVM